MTIELTSRALASVSKIKKEPSIVLEFDGIDTRFGSATIERIVRIGDEGLLIGNSWRIGGKVALDDQITSISFDSSFGSTSTSLDYNLNPDLGNSEGVRGLRIACVDNMARDILSLFGSYEFLGRKCRVYLSPDPNDTTFPDDYIVIFRGICDDLEFPPGGIVFNIAHPDQRKRQTMFDSVETALPSGINDSVSSITVDDASGFIVPNTDTMLKTYFQIDNEIIRYTGVSTNTLTGCTRAQIGTTAASHSTDASVKSFYTIEGNPIDIALKLMLSGWSGPFVSGVEITSFNYINPTDTVANSIFFQDLNVKEYYGLVVGDLITTTGADDASNNVTEREILDIQVLESGSSYIVVDVASDFVDDLITSATISFRSKYDTLPIGLKMSPDEVDVEEHERLLDLFLSSFNYYIYVKDTIDSLKDFIDNEIYRPIACYSVPRKSKASVAYTIGPLPNAQIKTLNTNNVINAVNIAPKRSTGRNFYNTVIYKFDENALTEDFLQGYITTNSTSKTQIPVGTKSFIVISKGLRNANVAQSSAERRLNRYAFAATYINNVKTTFETGFNIEIADLVIMDGEDLRIADPLLGTRTSEPRFYEVTSKRLDFKTGEVVLGMVDTNFNGAGRYALISPASIIRNGISGTSFVIQSSFSSIYGTNEYKKWDGFSSPVIRVRSENYSTSATAVLVSTSGNTITVSPTLGFTPSAGMIMELGDYTNQTAQIKLLYTHSTNGSADFADGGSPYIMI